MADLTFPANDRYRTLTATGGETEVATDFPVKVADELEIWRTRAALRELLVLDTDYTLTGLGLQEGATAPLAVPAVAGDFFELMGATSIERTSVYTQENFSAGALNGDFDRQTMVAQELRRDLTRAAEKLADIDGEAAEQATAQAREYRDQAEAAATQTTADRVQTGLDVASADASAQAALAAAGPLYVDIATGRAAVADGEYFRVVGAAPKLFDLYRRDSSSTHTYITSAYSVQPLTSGELVGGSRGVYEAAAFGGASNNAGTRTLSIPAASSGNGSYSAGKAKVDADFPRLPVGTVVDLEAQWEITTDFLTDKPFNLSFFGRLTLASGTVNLSTSTVPGSSRVATLVGSEVIGTRLRRRVRYTVVGDELSLGAGFLIAGADTADGAHSAQLVSTSWVIYSLPASSGLSTPADVMFDVRQGAAFDAAGTSVIPQLHFGLGSVYSASTPAPQAFNAGSGGGVIAGADGRSSGWLIKAGATGQNSLAQTIWPFTGAGNAGKTLKIQHVQDISAGFDRSIQDQFQVRTSGGVVGRSAASTSASVVGTRRIATYTYVVIGDELDLRPYTNCISTDPTGADQSLTVRDFTVEVVSNPVSYLTTMDANLEVRDQANKANILSSALALMQNANVYAVTVMVAADGSGDYTHPADAYAAITDASLFKRYRVLVKPGFYTGRYNMSPPDYVDTIGVNRDLCWVHYENATDATSGQISGRSTYDWKRTGKLDSLTIDIRNGRYAVHLETDGSIPDGRQEIVNCRIEHYGNASATNGSAWPSVSCFAIGAGVSSGQTIVMRNSLMRGPAGGFSYHNNINFDKPSFVDAESCHFISTDVANSNCAFRILSMGSGVADLCRIVGCSFGGDILYGSGSSWGAPWGQTSLTKCPAITGEIKVYGHSNRGHFWKNRCAGQALRIYSNAYSAPSTIDLAGDLWPVIMGDGTTLKYSEDYSGGFSVIQGAKVGWGAITSDVAAGCTLAARLGDRSGTPITGTVSVNGGAPQTVTMNANYTGQSNATIIAAIQSQLTGCTVDSFNVGLYEMPAFGDEQTCVWLNSALTVAIGRGEPVAWTTRRGSLGKRMVNADAAYLFGGIALDNIRPGESGRVQVSGMIDLARVRTATPTGIAFRDPFGISSDGVISKASTPTLVYAGRFDALDLDWRAA